MCECAKTTTTTTKKTCNKDGGCERWASCTKLWKSAERKVSESYEKRERCRRRSVPRDRAMKMPSSASEPRSSPLDPPEGRGRVTSDRQLQIWPDSEEDLMGGRSDLNSWLLTPCNRWLQSLVHNPRHTHTHLDWLWLVWLIYHFLDIFSSDESIWATARQTANLKSGGGTRLTNDV